MTHEEMKSPKRPPMEWTKKVLIIVLVSAAFIFLAAEARFQWTRSVPITIAIYSDSSNASAAFQRRLEQFLGQPVQFEDVACILDLETKKGCPIKIARVEIRNAFKVLRIKSKIGRLAKEEGLEVLVE